MIPSSTVSTTKDWFAESLWGEYLRMLLVSLAGCSLLASLVRINVGWGLIWMALGFACLLAYLITSTRPLIVQAPLLSLAVALSIAAFQHKSAHAPLDAANFFCNPSVLLAVTTFLSIRELSLIARRTRWHTSPRKLTLLVVVTGLLGYMIVLPSLQTVWNSTQEMPSSYTLEEPTAMEHLRIRSSKLAMFGIFAAFGACVGSFLNVVADSTPRGRSIALRDSACPKCGSKIRRIDNLPIISYLNLGGRCRDCDTEIPIRYFLVELTAMFIVASLFLYELVTGAANVPSFPHYCYTGIVWIILYTKWPVVRIYSLHCLLFCFVLTLALMEGDRLRCPTWLAIGMLLTIAAIALAGPHSVPVTLFEQPSIPAPSLPPIVVRVLTVIAGATAGYGLSKLAFLARLRQR
ncbi:MAG: prepilin peptidase [Rhodopirellula sp. JB044]|uniref:prepilin peptidase n=1 Tax=Rhodopirellula sp. JB044 TaxID=3342844 RepID=UPI00370A9122